MYGAQGLDVGVFVGERDRNYTARSLPIAGTFSERQTLDDDLEVIPTPGHTPGTTSFLWDSGRHRFLFTGDTLWIEHGAWRVTVLGESDRAAYLDSLALLRELEFDVLVPWAATSGAPYIDVVTHAQAQQRLDAIIERVNAGGDA
jgi:glyoxylase-like metal-dependent hydrolase (beta-lactamase superfamily II)